MKIRTDDIYRIQSVKYKSVTSFVSGKVLDITYGKYLDYSKSKLLLKSGTKEVWSFDLLDVEPYLTLRQLNNDRIIYQLKNKDILNSISFDAVLAFNVLSIVDNYNDTLKFISKCLKSDGTAIISIVNDDGYQDNPHDLLTNDLTLFSKNDFEKNLKMYFGSVIFFSQGTVDHKKISDKNMKVVFKIKLRNFFLKSITRLNFYLKYIQPVQSLFVKSKQNIENKKTQRYDVTKFIEAKHPLFLIAICKK